MQAPEPTPESHSEVPVEVYAFGNFRIDLPTQRLFRDNEPVPIGAKAFDMLVALLKHRDRVVTKEELIKWIWPNTFVSDDSLTHTISALRRALGDDPAQPKFIVTMARRGYRFVAPVMSAAGDDSAVGLSTTPLPPELPKILGRPLWKPLAWTAAGALLGAVLLFAVQRIWFERPPSNTPLVQFTVEAPPGTMLVSGGVVSPHGQLLAFVARDESSGRTQIWVRSLDSAEARPLKGTEGGTRPFWSPDAQFVGFFVGRRLMRTGLAGDAPQSIAQTSGAQPSGASWSPLGRIIYADSGSLYAVSATGGTPAELTMARRRIWELASRPLFLPDGRQFLYSLISVNHDQAGTYVGSLDSNERIRILNGEGSSPVYSSDGYLIYIRDGVLLAHQFDLSELRLMGEARAVAGNLSTSADVSAGAGGVLTFGGGTKTDGPVWFDRTGKVVGSVSGTGPLENPAFSPDHRQLVGNTSPPSEGIWLVDLDRGGATRVASDGVAPVWAPDGNRIAFTARRGVHPRSIVSKVTTGLGDEVLLGANPTPPVAVNDWSPDGRYIVYITNSAGTKNDIWLLPTFGERTPSAFVATPANENQARISPDGRWIAYTSDESGVWEVYVQSFPVAGEKRTVSVGGGAQPQWRGDGKELYYVSLDNMLTAVAVTGDRTLQVGRPQPLFRLPVLDTLTSYPRLYAAARDGRQFLVKAGLPREPISVVVNWLAAGL